MKQLLLIWKEESVKKKKARRGVESHTLREMEAYTKNIIHSSSGGQFI
jgi:hypothetical protein